MRGDIIRKGKKNVKWDRDPEILARLETVAQMIVRGARAWQIADSLGVSITTANRDIRRVRTLWSREAKKGVEKARQESIAQVRAVQQQAWMRYDADKGLASLRLILESERDIVALEGTSAPSGVEITSGGQPISIREVVIEMPAEHEPVADSE